jgi:hypothetical protein
MFLPGVKVGQPVLKTAKCYAKPTIELKGINSGVVCFGKIKKSILKSIISIQEGRSK